MAVNARSRTNTDARSKTEAENTSKREWENAAIAALASRTQIADVSAGTRIGAERESTNGVHAAAASICDQERRPVATAAAAIVAVVANAARAESRLAERQAR